MGPRSFLAFIFAVAVAFSGYSFFAFGQSKNNIKSKPKVPIQPVFESPTPVAEMSKEQISELKETGDLDKFRKYCQWMKTEKEANRMPFKITGRQKDMTELELERVRASFEPRPTFKNEDLNIMFNNLVELSVEHSRINEIQVVCDLFDTFIEVNESDKSLKCYSAIKKLRIANKNPDQPQKLEIMKNQTLDDCSKTCPSFENKLKVIFPDKDSLNRNSQSPNILGNLEDLLKKDEALAALQKQFGPVPASVFFSMRRVEGGKVEDNKKHNIYGILPDGINKEPFKSLKESTQKYLEIMHCYGVAGYNWAHPKYVQLIYDADKSFMYPALNSLIQEHDLIEIRDKKRDQPLEQPGPGAR